MKFERDGWLKLIAVFCLFLGMLLALALKTQQFIRTKSGIPTTRAAGLAEALLDQRDRNKVLQERIDELIAEKERYMKALSEGSKQTEFLGEELQRARLLAGLTPVEGEGVVVTLRDNPTIPEDEDELLLISEYQIHDGDLRNFVNELLSAGAEAISISDLDNNQRIIATSSIRCVGGVIQINGVKMSPPFMINAIGPKNAMENALKMSKGIIEQFHAFPGVGKDMVDVKKKDKILVPAYTESTAFRYAAEVKPEGISK